MGNLWVLGTSLAVAACSGGAEFDEIGSFDRDLEAEFAGGDPGAVSSPADEGIDAMPPESLERDVVFLSALVGPSRAERFAEFQRQLNGTLSDEEREMLLERFARAGIPREQLRFSGRLVNYDGHGFVYVDELLAAAPTGETGD
jgi:hypothetical protein